MNKRVAQVFGILFLVVIYSFIALLYIRPYHLPFLGPITIVFLIILTFIAYLLFGFRLDKFSQLKKSSLLISIIIILFYFIIYYASGFILGFLKNSYSLTFGSIVGNTVIPLLFLLSIELLRYILIMSSKYTKTIFFLTSIVFTFFEIVVFSKFYPLNSQGLFKLFGLTILPIFSKNLLCGYLDQHVGVRAPILYRLIFDLYIFIVPIFPDCGEYLQAIVSILLPYIFYVYISRTVNIYNNQIKYDFSKKAFRLADLPFIIVVVLCVCLVSCLFPVFLMSVGSESMVPVINKGDAIIGYNISKDSSIKKGDILIFTSGNKMVVHRVNDITKKGDTIYYQTKGDANNTPDGKKITIKNVKGKVFCKIPFLGYPSVWLNEFVTKKK